MAKIDFRYCYTYVISSLSFNHTFDYFQERTSLFSRNDKPAFNQKDERFLKVTSRLTVSFK